MVFVSAAGATLTGGNGAFMAAGAMGLSGAGAMLTLESRFFLPRFFRGCCSLSDEDDEPERSGDDGA